MLTCERCLRIPTTPAIDPKIHKEPCLLPWLHGRGYDTWLTFDEALVLLRNWAGIMKRYANFEGETFHLPRKLRKALKTGTNGRVLLKFARTYPWSKCPEVHNLEGVPLVRWPK